MLAATLLLATSAARADRLEEAWRRANDAYLRGNYPAAVTAYEQLDREAQVPSAVLGELPERTAVGSLARLALDVGGGADLVRFGEDAEELVDGDQVVPDVEPTGGGVVGHPLSVGAQAGRDRALRAIGAHAVGAGKHDDAGHQPSDVPFERAGQRLIEIP